MITAEHIEYQNVNLWGTCQSNFNTHQQFRNAKEWKSKGVIPKTTTKTELDEVYPVIIHDHMMIFMNEKMIKMSQYENLHTITSNETINRKSEESKIMYQNLNNSTVILPKFTRTMEKPIEQYKQKSDRQNNQSLFHLERASMSRAKRNVRPEFSFASYISIHTNEK